MSDYIVRATAAGGQVRAFAISAVEMVETARSYHNTSPVMTAALGRLLCAGSMMGSMLKSEKDVLTLQIRGDGPAGGITVTAGADAHVKGYAINPDVRIKARKNFTIKIDNSPESYKSTAQPEFYAEPDFKLDVRGAIGKGYLSVIKDLGLKEPYNGRVELVSGEIAEDLTYYFATSEQTPSSVGLGVLMNKNNTVRCAGGFIIQLMPDALEETISAIENNLKGFPSVTACLDAGKSPEEMLSMLLNGLELEILDRIPAGYRCDCSHERIERAIASLGKKDLMEMIDAGEEIEVKCHFCNKAYKLSVEELKEIAGVK